MLLNSQTHSSFKATSTYSVKVQFPRGRLPAEGLERTRSCDHWILSPARLPVPPRRRQEGERENTSSHRPCKPSRKIDIFQIVGRPFLAAEFKCGGEDGRPTNSARQAQAVANFE